MFASSRTVAIDDNAIHLRGIKDALHSLQIDCHTVLYTEENGVDGKRFPGVRTLFLDLHLVTGGGVGIDNRHFAILAGIIDGIIDEKSGPYILVLWTQHPDLLNLLKDYIDGLDGNTLNNSKKPVAIYALNKGDYINVATGEPIAGSNLKDAIVEKISANPQMKALFSWEADILTAADATLRSIVNLVPDDMRTSENFGPSLGKLLFRISQAGAGKERAMENPRDSVNRVLVPVLADRVLQHDPEGQSSVAWKSALVPDKTNPKLISQATLNSAIHISSASATNSIPIKPTDLGAVVELPSTNPEKELKSRFGIDFNTLRSRSFFDLSQDEAWNRCQLCLIHIGASCDHAQPKDGPILYLLGIQWPFISDTGGKNLSPKRRAITEREWQTPIIDVGSDAVVPGRLSVFLNCSSSVKRTTGKRWKVMFRLREEIISQLTQEYARHISRPGVVSL